MWFASLVMQLIAYLGWALLLVDGLALVVILGPALVLVLHQPTPKITPMVHKQSCSTAIKTFFNLGFGLIGTIFMLKYVLCLKRGTKPTFRLADLRIMGYVETSNQCIEFATINERIMLIVLVSFCSHLFSYTVSHFWSVKVLHSFS